ncbi:unnamed protein product, partial [Brassica oleracea]
LPFCPKIEIGPVKKRVRLSSFFSANSLLPRFEYSSS